MLNMPLASDALPVTKVLSDFFKMRTFASSTGFSDSLSINFPEMELFDCACAITEIVNERANNSKE
jgi:hypothetical protein